MNNIPDANKIQAGATIQLPDTSPPKPTVAPGEQTDAQRAAAFRDAGVKPYSTPGTTVSPLSTAQLEQGVSLPDAGSFVGTQADAPNLSDSISQIAKKTLTSTGAAIDSLQADLQGTVTTDKAAAQEKVDATGKKIEDLGNEQSTAAQDALTSTRNKFEVEQTIKDLKSVQTKLVAAQEALDMGLIYEMGRPARQQLLVGRSASLKAQGLATIGALQSTAQILQGNINLAESYANSTIDAITADNANAMSALETMLGLYNDNLLDLKADEKDLLDKRIAALKDQDIELQRNKTDVFDLMQKYPSAAVAGGVTLLDSREEALAKMLPKMSEMEMRKYNDSVSSELSFDSDSDGAAEDKLSLVAARAGGMPYQEALAGWSDVLSIEWINKVYRGGAPGAPEADSRTNEQILEDQYYGSALDEFGNVKEGYTVNIDSKGRPTITPPDDNGFTWWKPNTWF